MVVRRAVVGDAPEDGAQTETDGRDPESGLATAEYAIATVAAATFAGILLAVIKGGDIKGMLTSLIQSALSLG